MGSDCQRVVMPSTVTPTVDEIVEATVEAVMPVVNTTGG
jgi:hypothetical protein